MKSETDVLPELVSASELAVMFGVSVRWVWKQADAGRLTRMRFSHRTVRFRVSEVRAFLESCEVKDG